MSEDGGRITVSKDFLRAELGSLELSLIDKLATRAEVEALEDKVEKIETAFEDRVDTLETEVDRLKIWRRALTGAVAVVSALALALLPETLRHYFGG